MQSKYDRVNSVICGLNNLSALDEYALINISNAIMNAEVLMQVIPQYKHDGNLDILAMIHLHYQNLGAALDNIPYGTRKQFEDLAAIYGESRGNKSKSFTLRSTVAHYKSFYELHANFNPEAAKVILEEASETHAALIKVVKAFSIPSSLRKLICDPIQDKAALIHGSSGFLYTAGKPIDLNSPLDLFSNCKAVMDVTNHCLTMAGNISNSLPMQSLVILARQFIGENIRQAYYVCSADMSAFLVRVDSLRKTRNKMAHKCIMFEQGADDPDSLVRRFTQVCSNYSKDFVTQIEALRADAESKRAPEADTGSRYAPLTVHVQEEMPAYTASDSSTSSSAASAAPVVASASVSLAQSNAANEFRSYVLNRLNEKTHNVSTLKRMQVWDIESMLQLAIVLLMNVNTITGVAKTKPEIQHDLETLGYIIDNFHTISDHEGSRDLINYPFPSYYNGPANIEYMGRQLHIGSQYTSMSVYRTTSTNIEDDNCNKFVKTIYTNLLVYSVMANNSKAVLFLLEKGANPNAFYYYPDGKIVTLLSYAILKQFDECAFALLDYGAVLTRKMLPEKELMYCDPTLKSVHDQILDKRKIPAFSTFEYLYRSGASYKFLLSFLQSVNSSELQRPRVIWETFLGEYRFCKKSEDSVFLLHSITKICINTWGLGFARELFEQCVLGLGGAENEKNNRAHRQRKLVVSHDFIYERWREQGAHEAADLFLNITSILKDSDNCGLHLAVLLDLNVVEYLCTTSIDIVLKQFKAKPKVEEFQAKDKDNIYTPGVLAKKLGKQAASDAIACFAMVRNTFKNGTVVSVIMSYHYDDAAIMQIQSSTYLSGAIGTNEGETVVLAGAKSEALIQNARKACAADRKLDYLVRDH